MATWVSLFGMLSAITSYFLKKKWQYLVAQGGAMALFAISSLLLGLYYASISCGLALLRIVVYYYLEKKEKSPSFAIRTFFAGLMVISYVVLNIVILKNYGLWDILLMVVNCLYVYLTGMRNLKLLRFWLLIPISLSVLYCIVVNMAIFTTISYALEFVANVAAIIIYKRVSIQKSIEQN